MLRGAGDGSPAGSGEPEERDAGYSILAEAAGVRFPDLRACEYPREKIDALVDHIAATAIHRGHVEALRLEAHSSLLDLRERFERLDSGQRYPSKARADEARRSRDPELAGAIKRAEWLVQRCTDQINRLDRDYDAASRTYTLLG